MRRLLIVGVLLLAAGCAREGYRLEAESATQAPVSSSDVERMCGEAFVDLPGARAGMTRQEVHTLVAQRYGGAAADAIDTSFGKSILARDDTLFLYTSALCDVEDLPARCRTACRDAKDIGKAR